ncbi:unnamed protein product [Closterium sp. NIES-53]
MCPLAATFPPNHQDFPKPSSEGRSARTPSTAGPATLEPSRSQISTNLDSSRSQFPSRSESRTEERLCSSRVTSRSGLSSEHSASSSERVVKNRGLLQIYSFPDVDNTSSTIVSEPSASVKPLPQASTASGSVIASTDAGAFPHVTGSGSPSFSRPRDLLSGAASAPGYPMATPERMDAFEALVRATSQELPLPAAPHVALHAEPDKQETELADQRQYDTSAAATASGEAAAGNPSKPSVEPSGDVRDGSLPDDVVEMNADVDVSKKSASKLLRQDSSNVATKPLNSRKSVDGKTGGGESPSDGSQKADVKAKSAAIDGSVGSSQFKVKWGNLTPADLLLLLSPTVASSVKVKPTGGGPYVCGVCEKRFPSLNSFNDHDHFTHGTRLHGSQDGNDFSLGDAAGLPRGSRSVRKGKGAAAAVAGRIRESVFGSTDRLFSSPQGGSYRIKRLRAETFEHPAAADLSERAGSVRSRRLGSAIADGSWTAQDKAGLRDGDATAGGRATVPSAVARGYKSKRSKIIAMAVAAASASDAQPLAAKATAADGSAEGAEGAHSPGARERSNAEGEVNNVSGENGARAENMQAGIVRRREKGGGKATPERKGKSPRRGRMTGKRTESVPGSAGREAQASTLGSAEALALHKEEIGRNRSYPEDVSISELLREGRQKRKRTEMSALEVTQHLAKCQSSRESLERGEKKSLAQLSQSSGSALGSSGDLLSLLANQQLMMQQTLQKQQRVRQYQDGKQPDERREDYQQDQQQQRQHLPLLEQIQEMLQLKFWQQQAPPPPPQLLQQQNPNHQQLIETQYIRAPNISTAQASSQTVLRSLPCALTPTSRPISPHPSHVSPVPYAVPRFRTPSAHSLDPSPPPLPPPLPVASAAAFPACSPAPGISYSSSHLQSSTQSCRFQSFVPAAGAESAAASGALQGMCGLSGEHALRSALVSAIVSRIEQMVGQGQTQAQAQLLSQLQAAQALLGQGEIKAGAEMQMKTLACGLMMQLQNSEPATPATAAAAATAAGSARAWAGDSGAANAHCQDAQNNGGRQLNEGGHGFQEVTDLDLELRL